MKKYYLMILLIGAIFVSACSNNVEIPEEAFVKQEHEEVTYEKYREQTVSEFKEHGQTYKEPEGYRFSLATITPFRGKQPIKTDIYTDKLKKKPAHQQVAEKKGMKKNKNVWERYCSQDELSKKELEYVLNNPLPEQYKEKCQPGK